MNRKIDEELYLQGWNSRDKQVGGDHYKKFNIQPWDIIDSWGLDFYEGNFLKYLLRDKGNRLEDLEKAKHYLEKIMSRPIMENREFDDNIEFGDIISCYNLYDKKEKSVLYYFHKSIIVKNDLDRYDNLTICILYLREMIECLKK